MRDTVTKPRRRVSFSDPKTKALSFPGDDAGSWDRTIAWLLTGVSFCVRFYRLGIPASVVFDEFHFGSFVDNILDRKTYFDIHPPLGKLTLALLGMLVGYRSVDGFDYDEIGKDYGAVLYYPLREVAAVFGIVTVPLIYLTCRELGTTWVGALLSAGFFCFDNLNVIESRLILMDSQITFYLILSLYCSLKLWGSKYGTKQRFTWLTITGLVCGCSISVKWTALATPALIAVISFFGLHFLGDPLTLLECAWAGFCGIALYMALFYAHFKTMLKTGPGVGFFTEEFKQTLVGEPNYNPEATRDNFFKLFWYLNKYMLTANAGITTRHHWESYWYQWILNWRGLLYYNHEEKATGKWASVYLIGNPLVVWLTTGFVCMFLIISLFAGRYRSTATKIGVFNNYNLDTCMFLFWGWLINLLPYILVDRSAFVYHYLPGLLYAQLLSGVLIDMLPKKLSILSMTLCLGAVVATYIYYVPWTYCFPITSAEHAERRWLPRWD